MEYSFSDTPVAWAIFIITIGVSIWAFYNKEIHEKFMLHPYSAFHGKNTYTVITSGFIHADWMHLIFNMVSYYFFAFPLEMLLGHWQFGMLYIVSLILSDMPTVAKERDNWGYRSLGASGAVSAVIFAVILFAPTGTIYLYAIPMTCWMYGILYLVYCWYASKHARDNINHDAHFYGALSGILITVLLHHQVVPEFFHKLGIGG